MNFLLISRRSSEYLVSLEPTVSRSIALLAGQRIYFSIMDCLDHCPFNMRADKIVKKKVDKPAEFVVFRGPPIVAETRRLT